MLKRNNSKPSLERQRMKFIPYGKLPNLSTNQGISVLSSSEYVKLIKYRVDFFYDNREENRSSDSDNVHLT